MQKKAIKPAQILESVLTHGLLIFGAFLSLVPFAWMVLTSLKTMGEATHIPIVIFPTVPRWENFAEVLKTLPFLTFYQNTILTTLGQTLGQVVLCSAAAYAFARIQFPGRDFLFLIVLSTLMLPSYIMLVPQYLIMKNLGWLNSLQALIVPGLFSAFGTFLLRQFFMSIPKELDEAAKIDGASHLQIYWHVILPLSRSALIALAIAVILWSWNSLLWPLIVNDSLDKMTISAGLASLQGEHATDFSLLMSGAVMAVWPMIVIFMLLQRHFIRGIAITGLKG